MIEKVVSMLGVLSFLLFVQVDSVWSQSFGRYIGGSAWERTQSVYVDGNGFIYICGTTQSADFPATAGAFQTTHSPLGGGSKNDGWVAKLSPNGTNIIWATYLRGSKRDDIYGVRADTSGYVYVTGWSDSSDFPTTTGAYDRTLGSNNNTDIIVAKIEPDGSDLVYSTFIGGGGIDQCRGAMDIGPGGEIYLSGYTDSTDFPTTPGALQSSFQGGYGDACICKLSADGSTLQFSSYLGTTGPDDAFGGIRLFSDGSLTVVGLAGGAGFPTTSGALQTTYGGHSNSDPSNPWYGDVFLLRFSLTPTHSAVVHFSTYFGGAGNDFAGGQHTLALDANGNAIVAFATSSSNLPAPSGTYQSTINGTDNLYVAKFPQDGASLLAGTYLGNKSVAIEPSGTQVSPTGDIYVSGSLYNNSSGSLPTTTDALQSGALGGHDGFLSRWSSDLKTLFYCSYVGGSGHDRIRDLSLGPNGGIFVGGDTYSTDFASVTLGLYNGKGDAWISKSAVTRLGALPDNDADGIPNVWEASYGLDPDDPSDAIVDTDGDGSMNKDEYVVGTNPSVSNDSTYKADASLSDNDLTVSILTIPGGGVGYKGLERRFTIQVSPQLRNPSWTDVPLVSDVLGSGQRIVYTDTGIDAISQFRVMIRLALAGG